ncbi:hypothetical protein FRC00_013700 [Tulasnella sp. 408]|nr:hypothetical protein FRC00_013700 [Tulasnella sp. 408]
MSGFPHVRIPDMVYVAPSRPTTPTIPMYDFESSSGSSNYEHLAIKQRFGSVCILCGYPAHTVEVVEILADGASKAGMFAIVPSPNVRKQMKEHEVRHFELRQRAISMGVSDPGRHLLMPPEVSSAPYCPERQSQGMLSSFRANLNTFLSPQNRKGMKKLPLRRWEVSVYAALMAACKSLRDPGRIHSTRSNAAFNEVTELVTMYGRRTVTQVQASPGGPIAAGEVEGLSDGNDDPESESTNTERPDPVDYDDEPVVTPAILSSRMRWTPAMSAYSLEGSMRFATSSDFVREPSDEPQEE